MTATRLKICGVTTVEDATMCRDAGVDAIGLNFWSGSKRCVSPEQAKRIADAARGGVSIVGVFVDEAPHVVEETVRLVGLDAIQPHGDAEPRLYAALGIPWVWVIRDAMAPLRVPTPLPQWVLLDAPTPGFGGQGVVADWEWAARAVEALSPLPVWLAGGLRSDNAVAAIAQVAPAGLDVASGAESTDDPRRKDAVAVAELLAICRQRR